MAARKRSTTEDDFVQTTLKSELAALRIHSGYFSKFVTAAAQRLGVEERLIVARLRMVFGGRPAPASFAILMRDFFRSGGHLGLIEETESGILFQSPPENMDSVKKFVFGLPKVALSRVVRATWTGGEAMLGGLYIFINAPDAKDNPDAVQKWVPVGKDKHRTRAVCKFWDPIWDAIGNSLEIEGETVSIFVYEAGSQDPLSIADTEDSLDDRSDRVLHLWQVVRILEQVFDGRTAKLTEPFVMQHFARRMFYTFDSREIHGSARIEKEDVRGVDVDLWRAVWDGGLVKGEAMAAAQLVREAFSTQLRGLRAKYRRAIPYLNDATIALINPTLEFDLLAAGNVMASAWQSFWRAHGAEFTDSLRDWWNEHRNDENIPYPEPSPLFRVPPDVREEEAVEFLKVMGLPHDVTAFQAIAEAARKPEAQAAMLKKHRYLGANGVHLGAVVEAIEKREESSLLSSGFTLGPGLVTALSHMFNVTFEGDAKSRESVMVVVAKAPRPSQKPIRYFLRNRSQDTSLSEYEQGFAALIHLMREKSAKR